jgi:hypothetical protein
MAITRTLKLLMSTIVLLGAAAGCSPEVPANPTYNRDVQPILAAHCVRCHGANDMLNVNPDAKLAAPNNKPLICYLNTFADVNCPDVATCRRGAAYCATMLIGRINRSDSDPLAMPPTPSDRLNDWEVDVLTRWSMNPVEM